MTNKWLDIRLLKFALAILAVITVTNAIASDPNSDSEEDQATRAVQQPSSSPVPSDNEDTAEAEENNPLARSWLEVNAGADTQDDPTNDSSILAEAQKVYSLVPRLIAYVRGTNSDDDDQKDGGINDVGTAVGAAQDISTSVTRILTLVGIHYNLNQARITNTTNSAIALGKKVQGMLPSLSPDPTPDDSQEN